MIIIYEYLLYFSILICTVMVMSYILGIRPGTHKYSALDGLRGVCAALVAIFHLYWRAGGVQNNYWSLDYIINSEAKKFIYLTGELSVGIFFMLSGFLFFRKALAESFDFKGFAVSRFMRIYPPIVVTLVLIYLSTFIMYPESASYSFDWFKSSLPFIFEPPTALINGLSLQIATSGVFWTLVWELRLYFAIPLLYLLMKKVKYKSFFIIFLMCCILTYKSFISKEQYLSFLMYFLVGFLIATIKTEKRVPDLLAILILALVLFFTKHAYNTTTPLYMFFIFYTIKCGCDYFGLLTSKPFMLLGTCSYSIYLIHGITQTVAKNHLYSSGSYLWQIIAIIATGILSPVMYKFVENISMNYKKYIPQTSTQA